jgi:outer membrane protein assembly factor BamB
MVAPETNLPETFTLGQHSADGETADLSTAPHVRWAARLGTQTFGTPVVSQGHVLVGTNLVENDPRFSGNRATLLCFEEKTGALLWQLSLPRPSAPNLAVGQKLGICASPTVEGDRVYLCGWSDILCLALDGQKDPRPGLAEQAQLVAGAGKAPIHTATCDGKILWRFDIVRELGINPHDALAGAPLIVGNLLFISTGNGVNQSHKVRETPDAPCLVALDKTTGKLVAQDTEHIARRTLHGQWSSPSLALVAGKPQVLFGGGDGVLYAFDPTPIAEAGKPATFRKLWSYDVNRGNPRPYRSPGGPSEIVSTPIYVDGRVYVSTGQDWTHQPLDQGHLACIDATGSGTIAAPIWDYTDIAWSVGTPAVADGLLYAADLAGTVHCLDAATGAVLWHFDKAGPFHASPLVADGKVYIANASGKLYVFAHARVPKLLATLDLHAGAAGMVVAANQTLLIATSRTLYTVTK